MHMYTRYSETWELGTPKGLRKSVLYSEVVLFLRSISTYWIQRRNEVGVLNSQGVLISQVVLKTGSTVFTPPSALPGINISNISYMVLILLMCVCSSTNGNSTLLMCCDWQVARLAFEKVLFNRVRYWKNATNIPCRPSIVFQYFDVFFFLFDFFSMVSILACQSHTSRPV